MLKMTGVKLEKASDIDMYLFIEKGLRGGTSYIARTYSEGNNKYLKDNDPTKQSRFISYLGMNNLYGYLLSICVAMSGYLPCSGFRWLKNVDNFDVNLYNSSRITCSYLSMLSDYSKKIADEYGIKVGDVMKLIPNLGGKTNNVLHYKNLQYLSLYDQIPSGSK